MYKTKVVSAIIPARDEEQCIGKVVTELFSVTDSAGQQVFDHVVVCDNASTDQTSKTAQAAGATAIWESTPGYGIACLSALGAMPESDIIVFIDGDYSFHTEQSIQLIDEIFCGADLVIGSRAKGKTQAGALTLPQQFGNWLATKLIKLLWQAPCSDLGPFRAISSSALDKINMEDKRFGWTVEMQVKAIQLGMTIIEIPVDTRPRIGVSKISGTVRGVIGAALGIFGTIFKLWARERIAKSNRRASTTNSNR